MTFEKSWVLAHARDAAWLLEIWLIIHGGDPPPDPQQINLDARTVQLVGELFEHFRQAYLPSASASLSESELIERLQLVGLEVNHPDPIPWREGGAGEQVELEVPRVSRPRRRLCYYFDDNLVFCFNHSGYVPTTHRPVTES